MNTQTIEPNGFRLALFSDTFAPQMNGVSRTLERLAAEIRNRGGDVLTFTTSDPDASPDPAVCRFESIPFWAYPQLRIALPSRTDVIGKVREFQPTLIHAATPFGIGLAGRAAAATLHIPFVTSYHTSFSAYADYYGLGALQTPGWAFLRWFHNKGRRTYCPTHAIKAELEAHGFDRVGVWGRGIDTGRFSPRYRSDTLRAALDVDEHTVLVGYVGRIAREKGIDVLLHAIPRILERTDRRVRFVFAGDGPYEKACRARQLPATTFMGRLTGLALSELYASLDMFVFPSITDTFGNVLLEAAASGAAIVAADTQPTRELLGDAAASLFEPGNAEALAALAATLIQQPSRRVSLSEQALRIARTKTWTSVFDELFSDDGRAIGTQLAPPTPALHGSRA